jgi:hypothetical protein
MQVNLSYALAGLHEASNFIWENNPSVKNWPSRPESVFDVMQGMRDMMKRDALRNATVILKEKRLQVQLHNEWLDYTGTGGYYFIYELISDEDSEEVTIGVSILVDPAVGSPDKGYVTEYVDKIEETV